MDRIHVALVARDPDIRSALGAAFARAPAEWDVTLCDSPVSADVLVCERELAVPGAVVFDPAEADRALRSVAHRLGTGGGGRSLVVMGAGGGVGATTFALHLSAALATGHRCCYLDLDTAWGAAAHFDLDRGEVKTWADAGTDADELRLAALPLRGGFRALFAPPTAAIPDDLITRTLAAFERVVVDVPLRAWDRVSLRPSALIFVVGATRASVDRAASALPAFDELPTAIVVNRSGSGGILSTADIAARLGRRVALYLPPTPSLRDASDAGHLLEGPWSRYCRRIAALAAALEAA